MPSLAVNIDHIATLRQARQGTEPDPVTAAHMAELAGAQCIICHLREDRRHINDRDLALLRQTVQTRLNLEMAATDEMQRICLETMPDIICLVPEKREELTTEGGLDVASRIDEIRDFLAPIIAADIETSLFIDADPKQIEAAKATGSEYIEIHTGHYADAKGRAATKAELEKILTGIKQAQDIGLKVNLGHGLNYVNVMDFSQVPGINEYSIGHSIISRAAYVGIGQAVREMNELVRSFVS
ncbi:pyridoxine 5'-phosphate synthase [Desulfovibrio ferrophilus]|uniref:Pyridoxine 5'-phosphate synthase n=1 Tax=Desulfovibrio ferrophilus TaxID=241368 RepID=A0A2Z6AWI7_9BACT|nr:pyridoxine 5'-phosphate synthase [Desulfovibrio ferrophilus]BBD07612.1 pyridoxal phosphate biosynthetic protein PdxJ [Desulfovibrio ferrophilus]